MGFGGVEEGAAGIAGAMSSVCEAERRGGGKRARAGR